MAHPRIILLFFGLLCSFPSIGQQTATSHDGKKVLLFEDGTWQYAYNLTPDISDDCEDYVGFLQDKSVLSGKVKVSVNSIYFGDHLEDEGMEILMVEDVEHVLIDIQTSGKEACFGPGDFGVFTFAGEHEVKLENIIAKNCEGQAQFLIELKNKGELKRFSGQKIKSVRLFHGEGSVQQDVDETAATSFMYTMKCMLGW